VVPSLSSYGGDGRLPSVKVFNENKEEIGFLFPASNSKVQTGQFIDLTVTQNLTYQQPTHIEVARGETGICMAYIDLTWPDGTLRGWLGDVEKYCGYRSYYSNLEVEMENGTMRKISSCEEII
jgi:hypothetical protein